MQQPVSLFSSMSPAPSPVSGASTPAASSSSMESSGLVDQFLLTALHNPRDRLTLLKLDNELETFVKDPLRTRLEFPPSSSYQRLMVHRVAHHFHLDHVVEAEGGRRCVVLFKNPQSVVPLLRLSDLIEQPEALPTKSVKIMRRSDPTSSANGGRNAQGGSSAQLGDRSLEQREEEYARARARIFGMESESTESKSSEQIKAEHMAECVTETKKAKPVTPTERRVLVEDKEGPEVWNRAWNPHTKQVEAYEYLNYYQEMNNTNFAPANLMWGDSSQYAHYGPPRPFPLEHTSEMLSHANNGETASYFPTAAAPLNPSPYPRNPPPVIYTFPNEDMWSFYSGNRTLSSAQDAFYYPYERRPPKSAVLFDPNIPGKPKNKSISEANSFPRSPSHESFFQPGHIPIPHNSRAKTPQPPLESNRSPKADHIEQAESEEAFSEITHILEMSNLDSVPSSEHFLMQLKDCGASIRKIDNSRGLAVFKTSGAAKTALGTVDASFYGLQPWRIPLTRALSK